MPAKVPNASAPIPTTPAPDGGSAPSRVAGGLTPGRRAVLVLTGLAAVTLWAYWPVLVTMARKWSSDPQYSHAYLVPVFSAYLLWSRWGPAAGGTSAEWRANWWGLLPLAAGVGLRLSGAYWYVDWLEAVSLLPVLAGVALLLAGWPALRRAGWAIAFLGFMIPLPYRVETALSQPLQRVATVVSTYALQTIGQPAIAEGNVILINESRIGVVEACNGLGMLLLFFALATGVALQVRRGWGERAVLVASAVPIAIAANVIRITVTGLLHETVGSQWADTVCHDLAGWLMMPLALGLLWLELQVLSRLFVDVECPTGPVRLIRPEPVRPSRPARTAPARAPAR
jgi:exosortase